MSFLSRRRGPLKPPASRRWPAADYLPDSGPVNTVVYQDLSARVPEAGATGGSRRQGTTVQTRRLPGVLHRPGLADDRDLDLAWILELLLDLAGDLVGQQRGRVVVDGPRGHHDPDLASRLHGVDLVDAVVAGGDLLEVA